MMKTRNTFVLSLLALALILCTVISPSLAYFTDQDQADGSITLTLSGKTDIQDDFKDGQKIIAIQNTKGRDIWVRLRVAVGETIQQYVDLIPGEGWTEQEGYWYYNSPIPENGATTNFIVDINRVPTKDLDLAQQEFNIAVLYETTPVQYNADGSWKSADWNIQLDTGTSSAGTEEGGEGNG